MVNKTKFSTLMAVIATISAIAAVGSVGGIGLGQQQTAFAQMVDSRSSGEDGGNLGNVVDIGRGIGEDLGNSAARIIGGCSAQFQNCSDTVRSEFTQCFFTSEFLQNLCENG
jgi:hypothetical protein